MDIVCTVCSDMFHVLAITFNTKTGFWNYEMTTCYNAECIIVIIILIIEFSSILIHLSFKDMRNQLFHCRYLLHVSAQLVPK